MLPTEIVVEECPYDEEYPDFEMVKRIGKQYAENLSGKLQKNYLLRLGLK
jgi:hypothetical protein